MPIARVGKFLETSDLGITHSLGIESFQLKECLSEINRRKIQGIFGSPAFGFTEDNLNFLKDISDIKQVWFWEINLKDISGLYNQKKIEYFCLSPKRPPIDFSAFTDLHDLIWEPINNDKGIEDLQQLVRLDIWKYKEKDMRFSKLQLPKSLKKIEFNWCNQESINSLPIMHNLTELQFHYCRNLKSIDGLKSLAPNLKKLVVTRCPNLESFSEAIDLPLDSLYINIKGKEIANYKHS